MTWSVIVGLALIGALSWVFGRPRRRSRNPVDDPAELAEAEREVRNLREGEEPRDWGPGAPR